MLSSNEPATDLLMAWRAGDAESGNRLFSAAYEELRRIAAARLREEPAGHTLQPTALVHELYLRLFASDPIACENRAHFLAIAGTNLRRILIDHARAAGAIRRGGAWVQVTFSDDLRADQTDEDVIADLIELDEVLEQLAVIDPRVSRAIELRFFGGLTEKEAAEVLGISLNTLKRDWVYGRAWLLNELSR